MACHGMPPGTWSNVQRRFSLACANRFLGLGCTGTCYTFSGRTRMLAGSSSRHNRGNVFFQCRSTERDIQSIRFVKVNPPPQKKKTIKDSISSCSRGAKRCRPTVFELSPLVVEEIRFRCVQWNGIDIACLPIRAVYMLGQSFSVRSSGFASNTMTS